MARAFSAQGWPLLSVHLAPFSNVSSPGFQKEADSLLSVTKLSIISDSQNMGKARDILLKLSEETNIFPTSWQLSERYLFVVVSSSERASLPASENGLMHRGAGRWKEIQVPGGIWGIPSRCCACSSLETCCSTINLLPKVLCSWVLS